MRILTSIMMSAWVLGNGCASTNVKVESTHFDESGLSSISPLDSGVLFKYDLLAAPSSGDCKLILKPDGKTAQKARFIVPVHPGSGIEFVRLPVGKYGFSEFECEDSRFAHVSDPRWSAWPPFESIAGKIAVLAPFKMNLRSATFSSSFDSRRDSQTEIARIEGKLSPESQKRFVSAYTETLITPEVIQNPSEATIYEIVDMKTGHALKQQGRPTLKYCLMAESTVNPLWLGSFQIEAIYENRKFVSANFIKEKSTFSTYFPECAEAALKGFIPASSNALKLLINL